MLFVSFFKWWYGDGWRQHARDMGIKLGGVVDYFSIDLLIKTLFQPFRQDSIGRVDGSLDVKLHAFADNMISRVLGAIIRLVILIFGLVAITGYAIISLITLVAWAFVPLAPIIGLTLTAMGVVF